MLDHASRTFRARSECVTCAYGDGIAILDLTSNVYFSLNAVGAEVWEALTKGADVEGLIVAIAASFEVPADVCRPDIERLLADLSAQGLIEAA